jgi:uncharacterized ion transporter superfamily protein YfcC
MSSTERRGIPHAVVMMLLIIVAAVVMTYLVPSGRFTRDKAGLVEPGSFRPIAKNYSAALTLPSQRSDSMAYPAHPIAVVAAIPVGMTRVASLIFMILFIGGMFGVLQATGAVETGVERLVAVTRGNALIVVPVFMVMLAVGSSFLGLISEYLVIIPIALVLAARLGYDAVFGTAIVTVAAKIGYLTSVTNPLALAIAQPIVGVPVFSGMWFRAITLIVFLPIGIAYVLWRRHDHRLASPSEGQSDSQAAPVPHPATATLGARQIAVLLLTALAIVVMLYGVEERDWGNPELSAMYLALALAIAVVGGIRSREASQAFIKGMQGMVLAALLVGLAAAVETILRDGMVLDTIVAFLARSVEGRHPVVVANLMMLIQMVIDVFIPSTSGKAAITMPILGPIGQIAGVSGQITVQAFLFGNGLMNTLTPTSGMLLAYLATGKVSFGQWIRFVMPLALVLFALCIVALTVGVLIGF